MAELQRTLGPVLIWGLGVGYVISGMYFGWNLGLPEGGPYGMLVATAVVTVLYVSFVLGYAELACALPRAGVVPKCSWRSGSADPLPHGWGKGVLAALPFAIWFYLAIEGIANVAEEARDPQRDLPRGFLWAMATLVALTAVTLFGAVGASG